MDLKKSDADLNQLPYMQSFGKYNRRIGDTKQQERVKEHKLSDDEKLEIEK